MRRCKQTTGNDLFCHILGLQLLPLLLLVHAVFPQTFSLFNRYDLSYAIIESNRQAIKDSGVVTWWSLHATDSCLQSNKCLNFEAKEQALSVGLGTVAGYEYFSKSSRFGTIQGDIDYFSPYLKARIAVDVYSTERRVVSPVADVQFERFIKENGELPIVGMFDFRANLPEAYLSTSYKALTLTTGKHKIRWGPGYKGTLGLSGVAYSPFYFYDLNCAFGNVLNMKAFLCGYEDESIYRKELTISEKTTVTKSKIDLKTFLPRYGAGQRLDLRVGNHIQIGIYELVDFFGSNELTRFVNPLQLYYLSNETSGTNNANLLGGMDFNVTVNQLRLYGEFLNDDITIFENAGNPNKYALQAGVAYYGKSSLLQAGIEYTHVSRYVYGHSRVLSRHGVWGESLGWPWGNDQDVATAYALFSLPYTIHAKIETNYWLKGEWAIENDWDADGEPNLDHAPYFPKDPAKICSAIVSAEYSPRSWLTYSLYWEPVVQHKKLTNGIYTYLAVRFPGKRECRVD